MWTEHPRPFMDGLLMATAVGLVLSVIVSNGCRHEPAAVTSSQCQEVIVTVQKNGQVLARCPRGTRLDIVGDYVVCRCGHSREPESFDIEHAPDPPSQLPPPTQLIPPADSTNPFDDKHETWI
jgi:hypothetical protein